MTRSPSDPLPPSQPPPPALGAVELHPQPSDEALAALHGTNPPVAKIDRALIPPRYRGTSDDPMHAPSGTPDPGPTIPTRTPPP